MNRRDFLKIMTAGIAGLGLVPDVMAQMQRIRITPRVSDFDNDIKDYLIKMKSFNEPHEGDIYISRDEYPVFESTVMRLNRLEEFAGHGNFYILSFDEGIKIADTYSEVGAFPPKELEFLEKLFYAEAVDYGFFGQKTIQKITDQVNKREVTRIAESGNYVFKGEPFHTYEKIKKQVGDNVILTSGIRGVMKQFLLFLNKAYSNNGNLSLASRSLAPPGYSFHGNGDFDVGENDLGSDNFTERFATTEVYHRLSELGYLKLRYPAGNLLGVRFEPWHIKVV